MANITNATRDWQSVTLATAELWQVRDGEIEIDTDVNAAARIGLLLKVNDSIELPATTVYYRLGAGFSAIIARMAI